MVKEQVRQIVDRLPADATWNDVMDELYVKAQEETATKRAELRPNTSERRVAGSMASRHRRTRRKR